MACKFTPVFASYAISQSFFSCICGAFLVLSYRATPMSYVLRLIIQFTITPKRRVKKLK